MRITLIAFIILSINIYSQNTYEFLRVDVSPRTAALGGSFVAVNDDADAIFYNPAGLSYLSGTPVSLSFTKYLVDINYASLAVSREFQDIGRISAGIKYVNYGTFTGRDEYGNQTTDFGVGEFAVKTSYSNFLDANLSYGVSAGFIFSKIADYSSSAFCFDAGLNYAIPSERINLALALVNVGSQFSPYIETKEKLPFDINVGVSKRLQNLPLKIYLDVHRLNNTSESFSKRLSNFSVGGEFSLSKALKVRLGYESKKRTELKIGNFAGLAGFNLGFGLTIKSYLLNYSFSSMGQIGAIHRFGLNTSLE